MAENNVQNTESEIEIENFEEGSANQFGKEQKSCNLAASTSRYSYAGFSNIEKHDNEDAKCKRISFDEIKSAANGCNCENSSICAIICRANP